MQKSNNLVIDLLDKNNNRISIKVPESKTDLTETQIVEFGTKIINSGLFVSNEGFPVVKIGGAKRVEMTTTQYKLA